MKLSRSDQKFIKEADKIARTQTIEELLKRIEGLEEERLQLVKLLQEARGTILSKALNADIEKLKNELWQAEERFAQGICIKIMESFHLTILGKLFFRKVR